MFKAVIADDEPLARRQIHNSLADFENIEVTAECNNGLEAVNAILQHRPHLVFLDIQMPAMDGLEALASIEKEYMPYVIFVTAYDQYAVQAFEHHAFDYLLKPYSAERFTRAVNRVLEFIERQQSAPSANSFLNIMQELKSPPKFIKRVAVRSTSSIYFIHVDEIEWIESAGNYLDIHTRDKAHLIRETMTHMEAKLDPEQFLRIHRSTIVNIDSILDIQPDGYNFQVRLKNGKTLGMSRKYKEALHERIQKLF